MVNKVRWGEDSIFNAAAGVGGKARFAGGVKGVHSLHQADGADGNKVFLVAGEGVIFFHDVCHQPQVVPDELFPRSGVPGPQRGESFGFFPGREWLWKAAAFQMECQDQKFGGKKLQQGQQHTGSLRSLRRKKCITGMYARRLGRYPNRKKNIREVYGTSLFVK